MSFRYACSFMAESGMDTEAYKIWQKEASGNVAVDGMFSIQVKSSTAASCLISNARRRCLSSIFLLESMR